MEEHERLRKKIRQAEALAGVPPEETLRMGFSLCRFGRDLGDVADQTLEDGGHTTISDE